MNAKYFASNKYFRADIAVIKNRSKIVNIVNWLKSFIKDNLVIISGSSIEKNGAATKVIAFITEHNVAFRTSIPLVQIMENIFPGSESAKNLQL